MMLFERFTDPGTDAQKSKRYAEGFALGHDAESVSIAINDTWSADMRDGGTLTSYERVGYHAGSTQFINGVLDARCPVRIFTSEGWRKIVKFV